jgi:hypothetical protein
VQLAASQEGLGSMELIHFTGKHTLHITIFSGLSKNLTNTIIYLEFSELFQTASGISTGTQSQNCSKTM